MNTLTQKGDAWAIRLPGDQWHRHAVTDRNTVFDGGEEMLIFRSVADAESKLRELRADASALGLSDAFAAAKVVALQLVTIAVPVVDEVPARATAMSTGYPF